MSSERRIAAPARAGRSQFQEPRQSEEQHDGNPDCVHEGSRFSIQEIIGSWANTLIITAQGLA